MDKPTVSKIKRAVEEPVRIPSKRTIRPEERIAKGNDEDSETEEDEGVKIDGELSKKKNKKAVEEPVRIPSKRSIRPEERIAKGNDEDSETDEDEAMKRSKEGKVVTDEGVSSSSKPPLTRKEIRKAERIAQKAKLNENKALERQGLRPKPEKKRKRVGDDDDEAIPTKSKDGGVKIDEDEGVKIDGELTSNKRRVKNKKKRQKDLLKRPAPFQTHAPKRVKVSPPMCNVPLPRIQGHLEERHRHVKRRSIEVYIDCENNPLPKRQSSFRKCHAIMVSNLRRWGFEHYRTHLFAAEFPINYLEDVPHCERHLVSIVSDVVERDSSRDASDIAMGKAMLARSLLLQPPAAFLLASSDDDFSTTIRDLNTSGFLVIRSVIEKKTKPSILENRDVCFWEAFVTLKDSRWVWNSPIPDPETVPSLRTKSETPFNGVTVLWDMDSCRFPDDQTPTQIREHISNALIQGSFKLSDIEAYFYVDGGYKEKDIRSLKDGKYKICPLYRPHQSKIKRKSVDDGRDHVDVRIAKRMYYWALTYAPPAPLLIISNNEELLGDMKVLKDNSFHVLLSYTGEVSSRMKWSACDSIKFETLRMRSWIVDDRTQFSSSAIQSFETASQLESQMGFIYRISTEQEWEEFKKSGSCFGGDLDKSTDCFHLSKFDQVQSTLKNFFSNVKEDLYLLQVDPKKLGDGLIYESVDDVNSFPRFYGPDKSFIPLPLDSVVKAEKLTYINGNFTCSFLR